MTRSRQTSASPTGDKEQPKDGKEEKSLEERIREDQDKFMKEIQETLSANITNSIKEAISSVQTGVEQKIADLSDKIEGQSGEFNSLRDMMAAFEGRVAKLEKRDKDEKANEMNKALEEEVLRELCEEELRLVIIGYE